MHDLKLRDPGRPDEDFTLEDVAIAREVAAEYAHLHRDENGPLREPLPGGIHRASTAPHRLDVELLQRDLAELDQRVTTLAEATLKAVHTITNELDNNRAVHRALLDWINGVELRLAQAGLGIRPPWWKRILPW